MCTIKKENQLHKETGFLVQRAVTKLNNRPRKRLNYLTFRKYLEREGVRLR